MHTHANTRTLKPSHARLHARTHTQGGRCIFEAGQFRLSPQSETALIAHMRAAELGDDGQAAFPMHKRKVGLRGLGSGLGLGFRLGLGCFLDA